MSPELLRAPQRLPDLIFHFKGPVISGRRLTHSSRRKAEAGAPATSPSLRARELRDLLPAGGRGRLHLQRRPHHPQVGRADRAVPAGVPGTHVHREPVSVAAGWAVRPRPPQLLAGRGAGCSLSSTPPPLPPPHGGAPGTECSLSSTPPPPRRAPGAECSPGRGPGGTELLWESRTWAPGWA